MNDSTPNPPLSSTSQNQPQDTLLQRGAFDPPFNPGTLGRLNRFEIIRLLGEGGMGQVYLAREPLTDTHVAVKIMKPQLADDPQSVHRFLTEARHMYRLSHPRILRVLEVSDRKEGAYYVMPYIAGGNLIAQCKPGEPMPAERIATIARQVAEALAHAHAHGLIHRDIKPGNILLDKEGNAFLTDFGLVRTVFNDSMVDATASHLEGTAPYMSPAVARGEAEDTRCDIYAFGAVLYELLTGQPPYTGRTPQMILDQILRGPPLPIRQVNPKANPALAKIAEGCMARELRDRYASMADVVADLASAAQGAASRDRQQSRLPKTLALLVGALVVVGVVGATIRIFSSTGRQEKSPTIARASLPPIPTSVEPTDPSHFVCTTTNGEVTIARYTGEGGAVVIPRTINGLPVIGIGDSAFVDCTTMTRVTMPPGIMRIGHSAFRGCTGLNNVDIPNSVREIRDWAFANCSGLRSVRIPALVKDIGPAPFGYCNGLTSIVVDEQNAFFSSADGILFNKDKSRIVSFAGGNGTSYTIPDTVKSIHWFAFAGCSNLTRITIPSSVTEIARGAFWHCASLTDGTIADSITTLGDRVFAGCSGLTNATIPSGASRIGTLFFSGCLGLTRIVIPESVASIDDAAFRGCDNLTAIYFKGNAPRIGNIFEGSKVEATIYYCLGTTGWDKDFAGRPTAVWEDAVAAAESPAPATLTEGPFIYTVTNGAVTIAKYTGEGGDVAIPSAINGVPVTTIGDNSFENCTNLTGIAIPSSVINIGWNAFWRCQSLPSVQIPASVTSIAPNAFVGCYGLTSIVVDAANPAYASSADGILLNKAMTTLAIYPAGKEGSYAIPESITEVAPGAFEKSTKLTGIDIPETVTNISGWAFQGCTGLTNVTIPNGVRTIGDTAFRDCTELASVVIPSSVAHIENMAFGYCHKLEGIFFKGNAPSLGDAVFPDDNKATVYYLPDATGWGKEFGGRPTAVWEPAETDPYQFACVASNGAVAIVRYTGGGGEINIPATISGLPVTSIGNSAFENCANVTGVTIPNSVTSIGEAAFKNCGKLAKVAIPNSVTNLGGGAFEGCTSLTRIAIPASVPRVEWHMFGGCSNLVSILVDPLNPNYSSSADGVLFNKDKTILLCYPAGKTGSYAIPASVTSIGNSGFKNCAGLASITIPNSVTSFGWDSFWYCSSLTNVAMPTSVTGVAPNLFAFCGRLNSITVDEANPTYSSIDGVVFSKDKTKLVRYPSGKTGNYTIPANVTAIETCAFEGSPGLTSVTIPNGVKRIEDCTFKECTNLTSVAIPDSVTSIGSRAFKDCFSLTKIEIPYGVTSIGDRAFQCCGSLGAVTISGSVVSIGEAAFELCPGLTSVTIPNGIKSVEAYTFKNCTNLTNVAIPDSVSRIGGQAFLGCANLRSITIPASVMIIGSDAFNSAGLTTVTIPDSVTDLANMGAFANCPNLASVTIGNGVTKLGDWTFDGCVSLTNVAIGTGVASIERGAFRGCSNLRGITLPDSLKVIGWDSFKCTGLTTITIPDSVTDITKWAFVGCTNLASVTVGGGVTNVELAAFESCSSLTGVYFKGNAPGGAADGSIFSGANNATIYYLPGTTGWGAEFGGRPTTAWEGGATNAVSSGTEHRSSYAERRQQRQREAQQQAAQIPKPAFTQAELEEHLQKYQMEVIRQGQPPLPVALTPESKAQLEKEGIVPPEPAPAMESGTVVNARPNAD